MPYKGGCAHPPLWGVHFGKPDVVLWACTGKVVRIQVEAGRGSIAGITARAPYRTTGGSIWVPQQVQAPWGKASYEMGQKEHSGSRGSVPRPVTKWGKRNSEERCKR